MRITLTVTDPATRRTRDVLLDADATMPAHRAVALLTGSDRPGRVFVDGRPLDPGTILAGSGLREGSMLSLDAPLRWSGVDESGPDGAPDRAPETPSPDGGIEVTRPPRLPRARAVRSFRLPPEPATPTPRPFPVLVTMLPLLGAVAFAWLAHNPTFLLLGLLGPLTMVGAAWSDRRGARGAARAAAAEHAQRTSAVQAAVLAALTSERLQRTAASPDPACVLAATTERGPRLWERRRHDADSLVLRVGTGDLPAETAVELPGRDGERHVDHPVIVDVPVIVPLGEVGVLGIAATGAVGRSVARFAVGQAAALHPPAALQIVVLCDPATAEDWSWTRWLPHVRPRLSQECEALLAVGTEAAAARIAEIVAVLERRAAPGTDPVTAAQAATEPDVLLVVDGARRLRALPGLAGVLRDGPAHGVLAICIDTDERLLPEECGAVVVECDDGSVRVARARHEPVDGVHPDLVDAEWADRLGRALAPLRDATPQGEEAALPKSARLLDLLGLETPDAHGVREGWRRSGGRTTRAVLGAGLDGPFEIDLRRDGPHALVAGTTGSGKSELLQTLVASLAAANRPDALSFVLIDYKGGAAFRECAQLPHTVGMVTDLDGGLVERALSSLRAELTRREHVLAACHAKDIDDHAARCGLDGGRPLARLVIVVDEFAALARELPEFVSGLVDIAQRGRSLGISLVLATQRPSGAVSPEIRANATLRVALRMSDAGESTDVIDAPDAARIPRTAPGRAYARLGPGSLVPFQAGRVGAPGSRAGTRLPFVLDLPLTALARRAATVPPGADRGDGDPPVPTDLGALVAAVREATEQEGLAPPSSPWLPPLPGSVQLADLPATCFALVDLPDRQLQRGVPVALETLGHLLVAGGARSGRSTVLRTLAATLARSYPVDDVHVYGLDCGSGALLALAQLPHCGAVVSRADPDRAGRVLLRLTDELRHRQRLLAEQGHSSITEQRAAARAAAGAPGLPHLVLLLDGWEGFTAGLAEIDGGRLLDAVLLLAREGAAAGVTLVVSGDRSVLTGGLAGAVESRLVLRLADPGDYALAGIPPRSVPAGGLSEGCAIPVSVAGVGPGVVPGARMQIALLDPDPSGAAQAGAVHLLATQLCGVLPAPAVPPFRVDALPARLTVAEALALPRPRGRSSGPWALVGAGGDDLRALGPDLSAGSGTFVVAGPPRSGRSGVLLAMAEALLVDSVPLLLLAPRASPLRAMTTRSGVEAVLTGEELDEPAGPDRLRAAVAALVARVAPERPRAVVLVDDGEALRDGTCREQLLDLVRRAATGGPALVVAGDADELCSGFSGWQVELRKARRGVLLSPQGLIDGDLIGVRVPRTRVGQPVEPGRGLLHLGDGALLDVRVPVA